MHQLRLAEAPMTGVSEPGGFAATFPGAWGLGQQRLVCSVVHVWEGGFEAAPVQGAAMSGGSLPLSFL